MERIAQEFFSMRMMVVALFVFLVSIGLATFAETVYDTQTARLMIYEANWFSILLLYLCAGMVANIFRYRMFRAEKISILTFHLAFIIMIIGAAVTRYFGFEGTMIINEGETIGYMYSADPYLVVEVSDEKDSYSWGRKLLMSEALSPEFEDEVPLLVNGAVKKEASVHCIGYQKNMVDSLVTRKDIKETALGFAIGGMEAQYLAEGQSTLLGATPLYYEVKDASSGVQVWKEGNKFKMKSSVGLRSLAMTQLRAIRESGEAPPDSLYDVVMPDSTITLEMAKLYNVQGEQFVLKDIKKNTARDWVKSPKKDAGLDLLEVKLEVNNKFSEPFFVPGGMKRIGHQNSVIRNHEGLKFKIEYGSKVVELPFGVRCEDFRLERYPGSSQPSSYESDLTIIDTAKNYQKTQELFMNHVIDYEGYRLFQSSYKADLSGTILQVNNDWWGTNISYFGYLLMGLGMVLALIAPGGRTRELIRKIKVIDEKRDKVSMIALLIAMSVGVNSYAQDSTDTNQMQKVVAVEEGHEGHNHAPGEHPNEPQSIEFPPKGKLNILSEEHAGELELLLVHSDVHKRAMPFHTLANQLLNKIHRGNTYEGYSAVQVIMNIHLNQSYWWDEPIIYVSSKGEIRESLGVEKYASMKDLMNLETGDFKLSKEAEEAFRKAESKRTEREKQIVKLVEKYQIMMNMMSPNWPYLRILPKNKGQEWLTILDFKQDSEEFLTAVNYFGALNAATRGEGGYGTAEDNLDKLLALQRKLGGKDIPSESMVKAEIAYNKMEVVKQAYRAFLAIGVLLLILFLIGLLAKGGKTPRWVRISEIVLFWMAVVTTLYLGAGLVMRALISGHVPWGDGYEALIFISFVAAVTGVALYRVNKVILAAACILAFLLLFVSSMNILDPEITKLQPVLKSYWLKIHVAIITGSYAPLGIAAILAFINMILFISRNKENDAQLKLVIKQITYITEIAITVGVVMLTIGTFLGGVWANESWGRYWGWDPKETWALVAILAYAVILHLRFIPGVKDQFTFNAVSFWGYTTILFTFFGVNFYLVGLHSYANGEGLAELPWWLVYVGIIFYLFTEFASLKNQLFKNKGEPIPMKHFSRKFIILSSLVVGVALMMLIFKISPATTVLANTGKILALILAATAIQYLIGGRKSNNQNAEILD
ncbi:MAG: cytochrome c biogenesis protein CcsA [bacterium]|nr:cytochrome c biogenesis protein CcsA [bacterium]